MDAKDLMIGNYIQDVWANELYFKITSLAKKTCTYENIQEFKTDYNKLRPIPLTEDWLVRFGSKKYQTHSDLIISYFIGLYDINYLLDQEWEFVVQKSYVLRSIKYVHELQNLYFVLSGKELTLRA